MVITPPTVEKINAQFEQYFSFFQRNATRVLDEDKIIIKYKPFARFWQCKYNESVKFDYERCGYNHKRSAVRRIPAVNDEHSDCVPIVQTVPCHQSEAMFGLQLPVKMRHVKECPGYWRTAINEVTPSERILAPAVENVVASGRILRVSQLIVKCPVCIAVSRTESSPMFISDGVTCHVDVETIDLGWPDAAATCDSSLYYNLYNRKSCL
ncbi:unnamed protein product [Toxocara canis]|uniref:RING-type domain-containing protein n=1 Tax=Toxocara canis TaxID=6265 RepID=A0A183V0L1_TOXCA|nr:unnamed protein product [Toxocara canis]